MPGNRIRLLGFLLLCLPSCTGVKPTLIPKPTPDPLETGQSAVYAAALQDLYGTSNYVIMADSSTGVGGVEDIDQTLEYVLQNMHDVEIETVENFRLRNDAAYPIQPGMDLDAEYYLLNQTERNRIFDQNQSGWEIFYDHYPYTPGITWLSRIGFNPGFNQALVYVGTQSNWLAGAGYYLLLNKVDGIWMVDQQVMTWIS